jgi:hypothetical protein
MSRAQQEGDHKTIANEFPLPTGRFHQVMGARFS